MTKMTDDDLLTTLSSMEKDAVKYNGEFMEGCAQGLSEYLGQPYGDEVEGQSSAVSTDIADVIEADMPSLVRVFLGANDILEFIANTDNSEEVAEAEQKTKYINYLVRKRPSSFKTIHDWIKDAEIQKFGVVKYYIETVKKPTERTFNGLSEDELVELMDTLKAETGVKSVKVVSRDIDNEGEAPVYNVKFRITKECQEICIRAIPIESFLITRNCSTPQEAEMLGDIEFKTRGQLLAEGWPEQKVGKIPTVSEDPEGSRMRQIRFASEGGFLPLTGREKNERVEIRNLYPLIDYDGDGIPERRNILKGGEVILQNEPYDRAPYALMSAMLMPHTAIGRSRAEIVSETQYIKTHLLRGTLNNMYQVNDPGLVVDDSANGGVDMDDLLVKRPGRIIRAEGDPSTKIMPLVIPYIGDKALQVIQYIDQARAQTTGSLLASQGLDADTLSKETATRFMGVKDVSVAKVELIARVMAETGFRDLFDGLAWMTKHYQNEAMEIMVLGKPLRISPKEWTYEHYCTSTVGLGAGDDEKVVENMTGILQMQTQMQAVGSPLVDAQKVYNTASKLVKALGQHRVSDFFNDPSQPDQVILAENEQLKVQLQQLQAAMQNPEVEKAKINALAKIAVETAKSEQQVKADLTQKQAQAEVNAAKEAGNAETEMGKFFLQQAQQQEQFNREERRKNEEFRANMLLELTKLDLQVEPEEDNIPGTLENTEADA